MLKIGMGIPYFKREGERDSSSIKTECIKNEREQCLSHVCVHDFKNIYVVNLFSKTTCDASC